MSRIPQPKYTGDILDKFSTNFQEWKTTFSFLARANIDEYRKYFVVPDYVEPAAMDYIPDTKLKRLELSASDHVPELISKMKRMNASNVNAKNKYAHVMTSY
jgi:hypothetical protein